ncbi:hypothetical protein PGT21_028080 [Puccinia graminis f. sp. tritici]|uniref:Uncharacterized protein n=1 Tax=Puccinia graminis f. sp. tritici TaxID=56615 RepID=A0A5B0S5C1_PUCGR|nr:hypothetical protein PGT21_028080 [Puccinia graminis f. sp. tritici]KAA1132987.1 hypothetical protein PGTUg99_018740 [Puccinia graminis f. sp. tritici]
MLEVRTWQISNDSGITCFGPSRGPEEGQHAHAIQPRFASLSGFIWFHQPPSKALNFLHWRSMCWMSLCDKSTATTTY